MITCCKCRQAVRPGDDYFVDNETIVCGECIDSYITERYDFYDIAEELGMTKKVVPDEEACENPEMPIPGQMDMFGGVVGENT